MGRGRSNLIQPGFETIGCRCMSGSTGEGSPPRGSSDLSILCQCSYMESIIKRRRTTSAHEATRDTATVRYANFELWLLVLIHSFAFAHMRLVSRCRIGLKAKTLLPIGWTGHSTSPYASSFITTCTIPLRQRSRTSWRTDLRNTPDYPTIGLRPGRLHLPFITPALLASFHTPDVPLLLWYW